MMSLFVVSNLKFCFEIITRNINLEIVSKIWDIRII